MQARLSRSEAVQLAYSQLEEFTGDYSDKEKRAKKYSKIDGAITYTHYGKVEIQELLDQIYGVNSAGDSVPMLFPRKEKNS
jgi:hypothetical protein|tara:strand:+ start:4442 stop:4684 length:243 start_codon:yes stop_codon:yes gene_type:complete